MNNLKSKGVPTVFAPVVLAALLSACAATGAPVTTTKPGAEATVSPSLIVSATLAVGSDITGVSLSNLSPDAKTVFAACHLGDEDQIPLDRVTGVGVLASTKDVLHYIPLTGREPQLVEEGPIWIVTVDFDLPMPGGGEVMIDPTCVVTGKDAGWYGIHGGRNTITGKVTPPEEPAQPPDRTLPPLAP